MNPNYTTINVEQSLEDKASIFHHYQRLIQLRKTNTTLVDGQFELLFADHPQVFAYLRKTDVETLLVVGNLSTERITLQLPDNVPTKSARVLISSGTPIDEISQPLQLAPYDAFIAALR